MYLLYKVALFILVLLGCMSEMLAAPVKFTEAVVSNAAESVKAATDGDEVRLKFECVIFRSNHPH